MNRKTILFAGVFLCLFSFFSCSKKNNPSPPAVVDTLNLTQGLVLYLPFNGSFADSSGNGNTVTPLNGAALDYDMHGYPQSAFSSTVNGPRLIVSNNGAYKVDSTFSISCDFMIRANAYYSGGYDFSGMMVFCSIVNVTTGAGPTFNFGMVNLAHPLNFGFGINAAQSPDDCTNNDSNGPNPPIGIYDSTTFTPQIGSWYNAICIFNKGTASVYINGQLVNSVTDATIPTALFCSESNFVVGGWWNGGNSGLETINGKLDEIRMYNRVLTAKEIAWLSRNFQPGSTKTTPGLKSNSPSAIVGN